MDESLIQDPASLARSCESLRTHAWMALDTEFMRTRTYRARLCLVQVATPEQIAQWVTLQIEALAEITARRGMRLAHVKPHGALYNAAAQQEAIATAIAQAVAEWDASLVLLGLSGSRLIEAGRAAGLTVMQEVFADRRYLPNGQLVSRETPGALITDPEIAAKQAYALAHDQPIIALDGSPLRLAADTLCLHCDTPGASGIARAVAQALDRG